MNSSITDDTKQLAFAQYHSQVPNVFLQHQNSVKIVIMSRLTNKEQSEAEEGFCNW